MVMFFRVRGHTFSNSTPSFRKCPVGFLIARLHPVFASTRASHNSCRPYMEANAEGRLLIVRRCRTDKQEMNDLRIGIVFVVQRSCLKILNLGYFEWIIEYCSCNLQQRVLLKMEVGKWNKINGFKEFRIFFLIKKETAIMLAFLKVLYCQLHSSSNPFRISKK